MTDPIPCEKIVTWLRDLANSGRHMYTEGLLESIKTIERLSEENEKLRARHNPEVCVDVQEYAEKLKAENQKQREVIQAYHETARNFVRKIRELSRIVKDVPAPEPSAALPQREKEW